MLLGGKGALELALFRKLYTKGSPLTFDFATPHVFPLRFSKYIMSRYKFFSVDDMLGEQYCTNLPSGFTPPPFPADAARIVHSVEPPEQIPEAYEPHQALLSDPAATSADGSIVFWSALKLLPANSLSTEVPRVRKSYKVPKPPKPGGRQPEKPDPEMTTTMQGKVKEVKSGDTLVLTSVHNPKQERILGLAFVDAPHFRRELGDEVSP